MRAEFTPEGGDASGTITTPDTGGALTTSARDPRDLWPAHARKLYEYLVALYGADDVLPTLAGGWIAHQRSENTRKAYARGFRVFEEFAREHGTHPMAVKFVLADAFRLHLETAPTWRRVKGGKRGEMERTGPPYSDASRANALSAASSFFVYLDKVSDDGVKNPFAAVQRPVIDPDFSHPQLHRGRVGHPRPHRPRPPPGPRLPGAVARAAAHAVLLLPAHRLPAQRPRRGPQRGPEPLRAAAEEGQGRRPKEEADPTARLGRAPDLPRRPHHRLALPDRAGQTARRTRGWRLFGSLARRAGLRPRGPHGIKGDAITHALAKPGARIDKVQRWAEHDDSRTTQRYNSRKELFEDSPGHP
ncbi:integrase [Streptomyces mesophilus]|uniref:integrase n=1 Tax=Streptomyces mesophilus TaxID=1775132 RepID=UPI001F24FC8C|nr:integrase [Streptomyces mesophilus]